VLLITGGMSMGRHDHVPAVLNQLRFDFKITKLRMKPGKPFVFATRAVGGRMQYVFGLPGNPVSAFVCAVRLASRLIDRLAGLPAPRERLSLFELADPLEVSGPREFYQPARLDGTKLHPLDWRGSADIITLSRADALMIRPENDPARAPGAIVTAIDLRR
jgi:molybdopterin molybdotransferase